MRCSIVIAAAILAVSVTSAHGENLLQNPGFESSGNWDIWSGGTSSNYAHTGSYSLVLGPGTGYTIAAQYNVPVTAGGQYDVSLWALNPTDSGTLTGTSSECLLKLEYFDASNTGVGTVYGNVFLNGSSPEGEWVHVVQQYTAPANTTHMTFNIYAGGTTSGTSHPYLDDVSFSPVPEPSTIVLLFIGLLGLLAYAWRKQK